METIAWLILLAVFLVIEAITTGLTTIWFAGGALLAGIAAYLGMDLIFQLILFFVVSVVLLVFTRPLAVKFMKKGVERTNVNSMIGKRALVTEEIDNLRESGKVRIQDIDWLARSSREGERIPKDSLVEIVRVTGVTLIVEEVKEEAL